MTGRRPPGRANAGATCRREEDWPSAVGAGPGSRRESCSRAWKENRIPAEASSQPAAREKPCWASP